MSQNPQPKRLSSVIGRIKDYQVKLASGESQVPEKDPNCTGGVSVPKHPDGDNLAKLNLPSDSRKENAAAPSQLTDKDTNPAGVGEGQVPATKPGDPKDESVSKPNDPLSKIAGVTARINALRKAPVAAPAAAPTKSAAAGAANDAVAGDIELTPEFHFKLASAILETDEGVAFAERVLAKKAGQSAAAEMIHNARMAQAQFEAIGHAYEENLQKEASAQAEGLAMAQEMFKNASAEEKEQIVKFATVHSRNLSRIAKPWIKSAYMQGTEDAASMMDSPEGQEQIPGGGDPGVEGGGPASLEEIAQILMQLVQEGKISEQEAQQIAQELAQAEGGEGGAGAPGGPGGADAAGAAPAGGGEPDGDEMPPGAAPEEPAEKAASELVRSLIKI